MTRLPGLKLPSNALSNKIPIELLYGRSPSYEHLKVCGCLCYMSTHKHGRDKFQARAILCIFLGYPYGKKAYKVIDLETKKVYNFRDVISHENVFTFSHSFPKPMHMPAESVSFDDNLLFFQLILPLSHLH